MRRPSKDVDALALVGLVFALAIVFSSANRYITGLAWIAVFQLSVLGMPLVLFWIIRRAEMSLGLARPRLPTIGLAFVLGCAVAVANIGLVIPLLPGEDDTAAGSALGSTQLWLALVVIAGLPALAEEILFRGVLFRAMAQRNRVVALVVSSFVFAGFHFSSDQLVPLFLVGLAAGAIVWISGSVWNAIVFHAANNALIIVLLDRGEGVLEHLGVASGLAAVGVGGLCLALARRVPTS